MVLTRMDGEKLGDKHYATLVVRVLLDQRGEVLHGELIDVDVTSEFHQPFSALPGLIATLQAWLASQ